MIAFPAVSSFTTFFHCMGKLMFESPLRNNEWNIGLVEGLEHLLVVGNKGFQLIGAVLKLGRVLMILKPLIN